MLKKVLIILLLSANTAMAASNMHIKMSGIDGESEDANHKGEIDVLSW